MAFVRLVNKWLLYRIFGMSANHGSAQRILVLLVVIENKLDRIIGLCLEVAVIAD